jgi:hypothetical protein
MKTSEDRHRADGSERLRRSSHWLLVSEGLMGPGRVVEADVVVVKKAPEVMPPS